MKTDDLLDAIGKMNPRYVREAEDKSDYEDAAASGPGTLAGDAHEKKKKQRRMKRRSLWLSAAACLCLLAAGGIYGLRQQGSSASADSAAGMEAALETDSGDDMDNAARMAQESADAVAESAEEERADASAESAEEEDIICINEITEVSGMVICMVEPASEQRMTLEEAEEYYGVRLMPEVLPEGIFCQEEDAFVIRYTEDGSVMDDNNQLIFQDAGGEIRLKIQARTTESDEITMFADEDLETSVIAGTPLTIGRSSWGEEESYYLAIYEKGDVTVTVQSYGIGEEELLAVLRSLLAE